MYEVIKCYKLRQKHTHECVLCIYMLVFICMYIYIYYIKLKSHLSIRLSVCTFWDTDNSAVSAQIETGLFEMKVVHLRIAKFVFKSLHVQ